LRDKAITHVTLPPAVLAVLPIAELPALQTIIAAGESCSPDIVKPWTANRRFFNAYGPTEATVWSTLAEISDESGKPPIGRPIANTQVYILDTQLQPVPIGITGELYIGGDGLARGYLNQPELTVERFISNPFKDFGFRGVGENSEDSETIESEDKSNNPKSTALPIPEVSSGTQRRKIQNPKSSRLYKTGDLARYRPDGNIEFLGRIDDQVKIRGFRIELGEIEVVLNQHPFVREAVAIALCAVAEPIAREDVPGNKRLVAYIVPNQEQLPTAEPESLAPLLRQFLKEKLPKYMIPSAFVVLESLPLTPNGKVDRRALPTLDSLIRPTERGFIAPRTPTEEAIAQIWAEVLKCDRVGIHDNFFDLGGDSLLAVRLIERIHKQFKQELPLSTLFLTPTVEGLANTLSSERDSLPWSSLVPIQPAGSNPPFFCVHPIFGVVFPYYELAYHLGTDQPFYALQPIGIDGKHPPLTRIEDMAAHYIKVLRTVQPEGPYFLGGWSFGGLVAFEMAKQLQREGHQVALLAVLDTLAPVSANKPSFWEGCKFLLTTVRRSIWPFVLDYFYLVTTPEKRRSNASQRKRQSDRVVSRSSKLNQALRRIRSHLSWHSFLGQAAIADFMPQESKRRIFRELALRPMFPVFKANSQATLSYVPQTYNGRITLFRTSLQVSRVHHDPTLGWNELTRQGVDVHIVPGNHLTMLRKPNVQVLAEQLRRYFEKANH
jgi:thioesterase domain-containing protein/acyl carrier protein